MKRIAIHQPNFLPWMGFFKKMERVDQFVFLDHVPFSKGSYTNRVRYFCKSSKKVKWLTLPIQKTRLATRICDVKLDSSSNWESKIIATIQQNINSSMGELITDTIRNRRTDYLVDLNISLINHLAGYFKISTPIIRSSQLELPVGEEQEVLKICEELSVSEYLSGKGAHRYLDFGAFAQKEIAVRVCDFAEIVREEVGEESEWVGMTGLYYT